MADVNVQIEGVLSWDKNGFAEVSDCATATKYKLGIMASTPYFTLYIKSEELSKEGGVLVNVEGSVKDNNENVINQPFVKSIKNGSCKKSAT
jgi:hypothetical protein